MFGGILCRLSPSGLLEELELFFFFFLMARRLGNVLRFGVSKAQTGLAEEESRSYDRYEDELQQRIIARLLFGDMTAL